MILNKEKSILRNTFSINIYLQRKVLKYQKKMRKTKKIKYSK